MQNNASCHKVKFWVAYRWLLIGDRFRRSGGWRPVMLLAADILKDWMWSGLAAGDWERAGLAGSWASQGGSLASDKPISAAWPSLQPSPGSNRPEKLPGEWGGWAGGRSGPASLGAGETGDCEPGWDERPARAEAGEGPAVVPATSRCQELPCSDRARCHE